MSSINSGMDVKTSLNYSIDDGQRQHFVSYQPTAEQRAADGVPEEMFKGGSKPVETTVCDARGKNFSLDAQSFELVEQTTSLSTEDFYNSPEKITDVYYTEMAKLFKKATGAAYVHVFHHQVRCASKNNADGNGFNTTVQPYAYSIHSDSSAHSAEDLFRRYAGTSVDKKYCKGRFLYLNAWRNITEAPIENNALAVCDETSLVKPDDYLGADLYLPGGSRLMQYRLNARNAAQHRWYYYSRMKKEEVLLFKQWDSDTTVPSRMSFHTAFSDPDARPDAPERESIECRGIAFFPDHEPNTCPGLPDDDAEVEGSEAITDEDEQVKAAVTKMLGLVDTIHTWPTFAKTWVISTAAKKDGAREVLKTIVQDDGNYQGFKQYSPEKKANIVELVMKSRWEAKLVAKLAQLKNNKTREYPYAFKSLTLVVAGCVLGYVSAWMRHA